MLISMACVAFAQTDSTRPARRLSFGAAASVGPTRINAALVLPGFSEECGLLQSGSGLVVRAGGLIELPLGDALGLQVRLLLAHVTARLQDPIPIAFPLARDDGAVVDGRIDQRLDLTRFDLGLDLLAQVPLLPRLSLLGGLNVDRTLSLIATHQQVAVSPGDLLLSNNRRELILNEGELLGAAGVVVAAAAGIAYDFPISSRGTLSPELMVGIPLTSETSDGDLKSIQLRFGGAIRWTTPTPPIVVPPPPPPPPAISATLRTHPPVVKVKITEYDSTEVLPLLNQVFFDEGNDAIPVRYHLVDKEGSLLFDKNDSLLRNGTALDVYYHILNLVGMRMRENVGATLKINGYRNGRERDGRLSMRRAEAVQRYLIDVWGVAPRRLVVNGGSLPPNPAREVTNEGFQENARVELVASDPRVTGPHVRIHTKGVATPSSVVFYPRVDAEAGIREWAIEIVQRDSLPWRRIASNGSPPDSIVWLWRSDRGTMPSYPLQLAYRLTVIDNAGQKKASDFTPIDVAYESTRQQLGHQENDSTVESYSLLLFNFDRPEVTPGDRALLEAICRGGNIGSGARVRFVGYTDSLGDASYNRTLAAERARDAARIFRSLVPADVQIFIDEEHGGEWERFPYSTPEGRSHCRTVFIEVRTPLERSR